MKALEWEKRSDSFAAKVGKRHYLIATYIGPGVYSADIFVPEGGIWTVGIAPTAEGAIKLFRGLETVRAIKAYVGDRVKSRKVKR